MEDVEIKKGDIVGRISYGKDILFYVDRIIKTKIGKSYAILRGVLYRIEADAELEDLEKMDKDFTEKEKRGYETEIKKRIERKTKNTLQQANWNSRNKQTNALILHLDGDRRYSQKSARYYQKLGINAIVKNIPENRQPQVVGNLIKKYQPDILVITRT